ncbi:MAG: hypothetical protein JSV91_06510 [Phycisphaerales bacterium]|nr:MAG: hypothetical protein JSV91_06510 [Phycisphaerales bacterium]
MRAIAKPIAAGVLAAALCSCATDQSVPDRGVTEDKTHAVALWDFESDVVGEVPGGWLITETNRTETLATWEIVTDSSSTPASHVLALTDSINYDGTYNLAIAEGTSFCDLDLTVRVRADSGVEDQGGGPIWRCVDRDNYYICRFNPLESNYRVYVVKDGRRKQLGSARTELEAGRWYEIRVVMKGPDIVCHLNGRKLLQVSDGTFPDAGMAGLWTKADAVTSFDNLTVRPIETN